MNLKLYHSRVSNIAPVLLLVVFFLPFSKAHNENRNPVNTSFVVVLDAGHGGRDPGNRGGGYREKEIALNIVKRVGDILESTSKIKVIYTRKTDVFLELRERAAIANNAKADLFVSIHCNAHRSQAQGTETFVLGLSSSKRNLEIAKKENSVIFLEDDYQVHYEGYDPNSPKSIIGITLMQEEFLDQSIMLAQKIQDDFSESQNLLSRGVKQANFWVLHNTYMPSVLVETGFLTNRSEGKYLNSKNGQKKMAQSIARAIVSYKNDLDQNVGEDISFETSLEGVLVEEEPDTLNKKINTNKDELKEPIQIEQSKAKLGVKNERGVVFKVQIMASLEKIPEKAEYFNGLSPISSEPYKSYTRYFYGSVSNFEAVKKLKKEAAKSGYTDCFVIARKDGKHISIKEALK